MSAGVYITIDVECSMGGAWADSVLKPVPPSRGIMGQYGPRSFGVPLIVDILNRHNLSATFFVEPFNDELGHPGQTEPVCHFLLDHNQDVQLHIHPCHKFYAQHLASLPYEKTDNFAALPPDRQRDLLAEGADRLKRYTSRFPLAFRAGNMAASEETLLQLARVGIRIDSSYTFTYIGKQCFFTDPAPYNGSKWYGNVLELALSGFYQPAFPGLRPSKPLDLMGISFEECRDVIVKNHAASVDSVLIIHSFSLFKVRNIQYDGGRLNWIIARRFRRLCRWLSENRDIHPAYTFTDLALAVEQGRYTARNVTPCRLSVGRAIIRKAVQAVNSFYWI